MALKNLFRRFFPHLTTGDVLKRFQRTLEKLHDVRDAHNDLASQHEEHASTHLGLAELARREANRACDAIERFEAVFGLSS